MRRLADIARVIRSKNAGPTLLTIDLIFPDADAFAQAACSAALSATVIAGRYGVAPATVRVLPFAPAHAIKIVIDRPIVSGSPGDGDVYGAQQHGPLLEIEL